MRDTSEVGGLENPAGLSVPDAAAVRRIRIAIRDASRALRVRHPWLTRRQDAIGLGLLCFSALLMSGSAALYVHQFVPALVCILVVAFACSLAHEIEHDLIHRMYYPRIAWLRHAMMALGWLMRPSTVNPWLRIHLHLAHHRISGTEGDLEERAITNGERWGLKRLLMTGDGFLSTVLRLPLHRPRVAARLFVRSTLAYGPLAWLYHAALASFLTLHVLHRLAPNAADLTSLLPTVDTIAVVWVLPNLLRTFCLHFVSSNIHYFGDVDEGDVLRQTQVLDHWCFLPLQLFCCNFGSTHAIHHFWISEPFYVRQWTARKAHVAMFANGVRFNDFATFARANRYGVPAPQPRAMSVRAAHG